MFSKDSQELLSIAYTRGITLIDVSAGSRSNFVWTIVV